MNAIVGVYGKNIHYIDYLFKSLEHRNLNQDKPFFLEDYNLALSSNLINYIKEFNQCLFFYGDIYNFDSLKKNFKLTLNTDNPNEIILQLYDHYLKYNNSINAIKKMMLQLDGDYSFVLWDDNRLILVRDSVGLKPIYYGFTDNTFVFASERKALWHIGINDTKTLTPGHILVINENILDESINIENSYDLIFVEEICDDNHICYNTHYSYNELKKHLKTNLITATKKRIKNVDDVAIIFSGGVDSTLITKIIQNENKNIKLYNVGTKNSNDLKFAKKAAEELNLDLYQIIIDKNIIEENLEEVLTAIEEFNVMKIGVAMPLHIASKMVHQDGFKIAVSGQGADELFGGYNKYLKNYSQLGPKTQNILYHDIKNSFHVNLERDETIAAFNDINLKAPFMDKTMINTAMEIPIKYKIKSDNDKLRKHILRDVALDLDVPEFIALRPKKAAQYGSGVHKLLMKKILPTFNEIEFMNNLQKPIYG